jgi:hypothetical protein
MATIVTVYATGGGGGGFAFGPAGVATESDGYETWKGGLSYGGIPTQGLNSGAGGDAGANGSNGTGSTGGTAGLAIDKDSNTVTVTNNGTISGTVQA